VSSPAENVTAAPHRRTPHVRRSGTREIVELVCGRSDILPLHGGEPDHPGASAHRRRGDTSFREARQIRARCRHPGPARGDGGEARLGQRHRGRRGTGDRHARSGPGLCRCVRHGPVEGDEALVPSISYPGYGPARRAKGREDPSLSGRPHGWLSPRSGLPGSTCERSDQDHRRQQSRQSDRRRSRSPDDHGPRRSRGAARRAAAVRRGVRGDLLRPAPTSPGAIAADNVVTLYSLSKTYAMTGWPRCAHSTAVVPRCWPTGSERCPRSSRCRTVATAPWSRMGAGPAGRGRSS
jgi:hypothetical protein